MHLEIRIAKKGIITINVFKKCWQILKMDQQYEWLGRFSFFLFI